jgi:hypothetical protein
MLFFYFIAKTVARKPQGVKIRDVRDFADFLRPRRQQNVEPRSLCHLNLTHGDDTKLSMRRNIFAKISIGIGSSK